MMKKLFFISVISVVVVSALIFGGCPKPAPTEVIELTLNLPTPPTHSRWLKVTEPLIKKIEEETGGRVDIVPYHAGALSTLPENYDSIVNGLADMGETFIGAKVGRFPLIENLLSTSPVSLNLENTSTLMWELYESSPELQDEFKETKVLCLHAVLPQGICSVEKPITSLEDIKGLKYNVTGAPIGVQKATALGASVVSIPMADVYMGAEKGVIEAAIGSWSLFLSRNWGDVFKYYTPLSINQSTFYFVMNKDKWNSLPEDIQQIFEKYTGAYAADMYGQVWLQEELESKEVWEKEMGGTTVYFSEEELVKADALVAPAIENYIAEMESKGYPYRDLYQRYLELAEKQIAPWP